MRREFFRNLEDNLYKNSIKKSLFITSVPSYFNLSFNNFYFNFLNLLRNKIYNYSNKLYEEIKNEISRLYKIPKNLLDKVKIYFVDNIPSYFTNTITLGMYSSTKDVYGKIYEASIFLPKWLVQYPKKLIETIVHELTHYIQDLNGKIKRNSTEYLNFSDYYNSEEEIEARNVSRLITSKIINRLYGNTRMYFL